MGKITAPFTPEQVESLRMFQNNPAVHPFTCCSHDGCDRMRQPNEGELIPTEEGWICPCGKWKQDWAHDFMLEIPGGFIIEDPMTKETFINKFLTASLTQKIFKPEAHTIPGRIMTMEELTCDITLERFTDWMVEVGEDYADQISLDKEQMKEFGIFLKTKYPERSDEADKILSEKYCDSLKIQQDFFGNEEKDIELFYIHLAEFINQSVGGLKAQTNANLILVMEYYSDGTFPSAND